MARQPAGLDLADALLRTSVFGDLSRPDVEELRPDVVVRSYDRGQPVWIEGDRADVLAIVADGQVKAHRVSREGREVIVAVYGAGDITGEVGLFHPVGMRWLSLSSMTRSVCLMLRRAPLLTFLARHPAAMQRMLESLSVTAVQAAYLFTDVAFHDIGRRVARLLVHLADEHGEPTPEGIRIRLRLSQGDLAAYAAASRENVNRALATFVSAGAVSHRSGYFYVHDRAALDAAGQPGQGAADL